MKTTRRFVAAASALLLSAGLLAGCGKPPPNPLSAEERQLIRDMRPLDINSGVSVVWCVQTFLAEACWNTLKEVILDTEVICDATNGEMTITFPIDYSDPNAGRVRMTRLAAANVAVKLKLSQEGPSNINPTEEDLAAALPQVQQLCSRRAALRTLQERVGVLLDDPELLARLQRRANR